MTETKSVYVVVCRDDTEPDGTPGEYVRATRQLFDAMGAMNYTKTVAKGRQAKIVTPEEYLILCEGFRPPVKSS